jgi:A/G-specific adenine glycosylase
MELGAVLCTSSSPGCPRCPIQADCQWRLAGYPAYSGPTGRPQRFAGTDRQVRGLLMDVLRAADGPVTQLELDLAWPDHAQRRRAQDSLIADGLIDPLPDGDFALPS